MMLENCVFNCIFFFPHQPLIVQGDLSKTEAAENLIDQTIKNHGKLDILVSILYLFIFFISIFFILHSKITKQALI